MELYLNSGSDYSIQDEKGKKYTPTQAKGLYEAGKVTNYNMAFWRLVQKGFDVQAVKDHFAAGNR